MPARVAAPPPPPASRQNQERLRRQSRRRPLVPAKRPNSQRRLDNVRNGILGDHARSTVDKMPKTHKKRSTAATPAVTRKSPDLYQETALSLAEKVGSPRLWTLLRQAQEEMERGTNLLGDELDKLWRNVRDAAERGEEKAQMDDYGETGRGGGDFSIHREKGRHIKRRSGESTRMGQRTIQQRHHGESARGVCDNGDGDVLFDQKHSAVVETVGAVDTVPSRRNPRLPPNEADALMAGLGRLQAEMEAEARSFQQHKVSLTRRLQDLRKIGRGKDKTRSEEVVELEEEAESMRTAVVASHARLLDRVRELQGVPNRIGKGRASISATAMATGPAAPLNVPSSSTNAATAPSASAATTVSHATAITVAAGTASASAATAPARTRATSKRVGPGMAANNNSSSSSSNESGRDLTDLVDNAHAVLAAREELAEMLTTVRATREELARERERARTAREQTSRLESLRSTAAAAAGRAARDADKARADAETAMHALGNARGGLAAAEASRRTAEEAAESERQRLGRLRGETAELRDRLQATGREVEGREARAEAVAAAADEEESRLADCRDSFGLEVDGLQKRVKELEAEAVGWREALEEARSSAAREDEERRAKRVRVETAKRRLEDTVEGLKAEARTWEVKVESRRRQHESDCEKFTQEARVATVELHKLKSRAADARARLRKGEEGLNAVAGALDEKTAAIDVTEAAGMSLERRAVELEASVADLQAQRDRASSEMDAARRRHAEEISHWKEAIAECRQEFEGLSGLMRAKAISLEDLEQKKTPQKAVLKTLLRHPLSHIETLQAESETARARKARSDREAAEARVEAVLRATREAARLAEKGKDKAEREEARAAAAETRTAEAVEQLRRVEAELSSESSLLDSIEADLQAARQSAGEAQAENAQARQQLAALAERRRQEESAMDAARQRTAVLAREEAELRATAAAARREGGDGREAANAARNDLTELREAVDRERRTLEKFRDEATTLEARVERKKEEDRFVRDKADGQQARLDEIKREVTLLRDERLRVEKNLWTLKSELEVLSTRRDDADRRDRRREREEGALAARREALADAVAREEERLSQAKSAKGKLEAEVKELETRVSNLTADVAGATQEAVALREDAAAAASRAAESRRKLTNLDRERAQLSSQADLLRATKGALNSELAGLRHELETLRRSHIESRGSGGGGRGARLEPVLRPVTAIKARVRDAVDDGEKPPHAGRIRLETTAPAGSNDVDDDQSSVGIGGGPAAEKAAGVRTTSFESFRKEAGGGVTMSGVSGGSGSGADSLVEVVADFQGRLRRQVRAALADAKHRVPGAGRDTSSDVDGVGKSPFPRGAMQVSDSVPPREAGHAVADANRGAGTSDRTYSKSKSKSKRAGSCRDILGELEKRVGSV